MKRAIGRRAFDFDREVAVMAIVNRTLDSFFDHGRTFDLPDAIRAVDKALDEEADWIDVGGVRSGPGPPVSESEESERVLPLVTAIRSKSDAVISIETYRPQLARRAIAAGADVVNDTFGLPDPQLAAVVAESGASLVITHYPKAPRTPIGRPTYDDVVAEVVAFLRGKAQDAQRRGVPAERIVVDPGFDMHKNPYHSLELLRRLEEVGELGYPVLVALSNKDFIGETLDLALDERGEGTLAALVVAILKGASIVRVHDVRAAVRAVRMTEAILGWRPPAAPRRGLG